MLIVFLQDFAFAQLQLMTFCGVIVVIIFGSTDSFRLPRDRRMEYFNEANIMCCVYHFFCFTDFVDAPARPYVGYSLIGNVVFGLVVNIVVMFKVAGSDIVFKLKKLRYLYRFWRARRKHFANHKRNKGMTD